MVIHMGVIVVVEVILLKAVATVVDFYNYKFPQLLIEVYIYYTSYTCWCSKEKWS